MGNNHLCCRTFLQLSLRWIEKSEYGSLEKGKSRNCLVRTCEAVCHLVAGDLDVAIGKLNFNTGFYGIAVSFLTSNIDFHFMISILNIVI